MFSNSRKIVVQCATLLQLLPHTYQKCIDELLLWDKLIVVLLSHLTAIQVQFNVHCLYLSQFYAYQYIGAHVCNGRPASRKCLLCALHSAVQAHDCTIILCIRHHFRWLFRYTGTGQIYQLVSTCDYTYFHRGTTEEKYRKSSLQRDLNFRTTTPHGSLQTWQQPVENLPAVSFLPTSKKTAFCVTIALFLELREALFLFSSFSCHSLTGQDSNTFTLCSRIDASQRGFARDQGLVSRSNTEARAQPKSSQQKIDVQMGSVVISVHRQGRNTKRRYDSSCTLNFFAVFITA